VRGFHVKQGSPPALSFLDRAIVDAERASLLRTRPQARTGDEVSFCSNDYLALGMRPPPRRPAGAGASRLVAGERIDHVELEREAAALVGLPASLVFTSGYAANVGLLSALAGPEDLIVSDAFNHASIVDGARLARARIVVVPHIDLGAVERALTETRRRRAFVVTESYFSMDADSPDLREMRGLCDAHDAALLVDESHALGVLGPEGRGLCAACGVEPDALVGTFGKAFGAGGAFVAGCPNLITWLWNRARSFVFSTGLSPAVAAAATAGIQAAKAEPRRRERVLAAARQLREGLHSLDIRPLGYGPIVPWILGEPAAAVHAASELRAEGIDVRAIRPPTVPVGTARLRFAVSAAHRGGDIERVVGAVSRILRRRG
jgi:8-amino-7-oxononanoate synthase